MRGISNTSGSYTLTRLRGYADGFLLNGFVSGQAWTGDDNVAVDLSDGQLALSMTANNESGYVFDEAGERLTDHYAQVRVEVTESTAGWTVHMTARQISTGTYYLMSVSEDGLWRFLLRQNGSDTIIRDWITHPAIVAGETEFEMGILANGKTLELFYNGSPLGYFADATLDGGIVGFGIETAPALNSTVEAVFRDLAITVPLENRPPVIRIIPEDPLSMARSLEHQQAIPSSGNLILNVPEASVQYSGSGVSRIALGRGSTFQNFVMGADVSIFPAGSMEAGCGIYMRAIDDDNYTLAYIDQTGAFGLAERNANGFLPGVFGEEATLATGEHQVLVVVQGELMQLYVDGLYRGEIQATDTEGTIGIAAVNFQQNVTTCNMRNIWLWTWE